MTSRSKSGSDKDLRGLVEQYVIEPQVLKTWGLLGVSYSTGENRCFRREESRFLHHIQELDDPFLYYLFSVEQSPDSRNTDGLSRFDVDSSCHLHLRFPLRDRRCGVPGGICAQEQADECHAAEYLQPFSYSVDHLRTPRIRPSLSECLEPFTSGSIFMPGAGTVANGRTILSGGLTLGLLVLPIIIINTQEALKSGS